MKAKDPKKEIETKFKLVKVKDGKVDLSKFEIEITNNKWNLKVERDGKELPNER